jgi:hypothetical protein
VELIKGSMFWLCGLIHVQSLISKKGEARETGRTLANDATAKQRDKYKAVKFCGEDARTILRKGAKGKLGDAYDFISLVETPVRTPFTRRLYTLLHEMDEVGRTLEPSPTEIDKYCHHCKEFFSCGGNVQQLTTHWSLLPPCGMCTRACTHQEAWESWQVHEFQCGGSSQTYE